MSLIGALVDAQAREAGWPKPAREYRFAPPRRWRADFFWDEQVYDQQSAKGGDSKVWLVDIPPTILEIEGGIFSGGRHTRGAGFLADMEKYNTAACMGFRLIRLTPQQVKAGELTGWLKRLAQSVEA